MREGERGSVFCHVLKTFKALCMFGIIQMQFEKLTSNLVWALMITASIYKIRASAEWLCLPLHQGNYYFYSSISKHYISVFLAKMAPPNLTVTNLSLMSFQDHDVIVIDSSGPIDSWKQLSFQCTSFNSFFFF